MATPVPLDVRDREKMNAWIEAADRDHPFDLVIANAGITTGLAPDAPTEHPDAVRAVLATNLMGVLNTVEPLIAPMCARSHGQIAFIGSMAGLRGLPYSPAYCMSKAAVHAYAELLARAARAARPMRQPCHCRICQNAAERFNYGDETFRNQRCARRRDYQVRTRPRQGDDRFSLAALYGGAARAAVARPPLRRIMSRIEANVPETRERV